MLAKIIELSGKLRSSTFAELFKLMQQMQSWTIVETGCYRGIRADGQSTIVLGMIAKFFKSRLISIDINNEHCLAAKKIVEDHDLQSSVIICNSDSVEWLSTMPQKIDVLYLDSFWSMENPDAGQRHHIAEAGAAFGKLSKKCLVLVDDCYSEYLKDGGKGGMAVPFLLDRSFKVEMKDYQVLLSRGFS